MYLFCFPAYVLFVCCCIYLLFCWVQRFRVLLSCSWTQKFHLKGNYHQCIYLFDYFLLSNSYKCLLLLVLAIPHCTSILYTTVLYLVLCLVSQCLFPYQFIHLLTCFSHSSFWLPRYVSIILQSLWHIFASTILVIFLGMQLSSDQLATLRTVFKRYREHDIPAWTTSLKKMKLPKDFLNSTVDMMKVLSMFSCWGPF